MGAKLAQHLDGSEVAKRRLEGILATITGELSIPEACQQLGISEARLYQLRTAVLEAGLSCLEPRPAGRPARVEEPGAVRIAELQEQLEEAQWEQQAAEVRAVIAETMPHLQTDEVVKKTADLKRRRKTLHRKNAGRRKKAR